MKQSPLFSRSYDLLLWLLPQASKFPRHFRFTLAERVQRQALDLHETFIFAGLHTGAGRRSYLRLADGRLAQLRHTLRLCKDLDLITVRQYEHAAGLLAEVGRLLGAWLKRAHE